MADKVIHLQSVVGPAQYGGGGNLNGAVNAAQTGLNRTQGTLNNEAEQDKAARDAQAAAQAAQNRPGAQQNAYDAQNAAGGANGNQAGAIELARRQAMGQAPGASIQSLQQGLRQSTAQQAAMGRSARGGAALATAQSNQNANTSNLQQQAFSSAGMMRSQDMATGRGLYNTLAAQGRDQAGAMQDEANQFGLANQGARDSHSLGMGNAAVGFGGVANGFNGQAFNQTVAAMDPLAAQDEANQAYQEQLAAQRKQAVAANNEDN